MILYIDISDDIGIKFFAIKSKSFATFVPIDTQKQIKLY